MFDVVFSREEFNDGTVLYYVDVEDALTKEVVFSAPRTYDTVGEAEEFARNHLFKPYGDARWVYVLLSSEDFASV